MPAAKPIPGVGLPPADELRRSVLATSMVFLILAVGTFIFKVGPEFSRGLFVFSWGASLLTVPTVRVIARALFRGRSWWGWPVVVMGAGKTGELLVRVLCRFPDLGLRPVAVFDDNPDKHGDLHGVPVLGGIDDAAEFADRHGIRHLLVAMPGIDRGRLLHVLGDHAERIPHIYVVPDLFGISSLWANAMDFRGTLVLEMRQELLLKRWQFAKRCMDFVLTVVGGLLILPIIGLLALAVKLDSPGPVFYGHGRIGRNGKTFKAWKFRSMVQNADAVLAKVLADNPEAQAEWDADQKLRDDPRITRIGKFLRKTSLDELPQLWNVIVGEMSLVGPRPIVQAEVEKYGDYFYLYSKVLPGITGLWQISGRNDTTYEQRVQLDVYYVRNWSFWIDIYILSRTFWAVVFKGGAY